ncbi:DUF4430 domain-containing protein [Methanofollis tationis]|uniref:DUF4430 domain-containing protein n=1 Tax=Methanofollis tationis TaxID=81417 RepID=A0A7K4HMV4_9EURY|nr:DUF4430 domain-containing protein [Methanofollis tationis]NVO66606.1 DUF4430 domain-containing protein [Methanofollis tationis]
MRRILTLLCLLAAIACTMPAAALSMDISGTTAGSAVIVTCDQEAFFVFQENSGTPVFARGTTVRYIPHTTGTLSIAAAAGGATVAETVTISAGGSGGDGGDGGDLYQNVVLPAGNLTVTAANSGTTYTVNRRTALGALDASGASYTIDDGWYDQYGTLYITAINGRTNRGASGWMYQVNGVSPSVGANAKTVQNGDRVVFYWSESMSSTPATSDEAIWLKVVYGSGSDSGDAGTTTAGSAAFGPATDPKTPVGLPEGVTTAVVGGKTRISVDLSAAHDGERVTVKGDRIIIERPGLVMTILTGDITERDGIATGFLKSVTAMLTPKSGTIAGIGDVGATLILSLNGVTALGDITVTYASNLSAEEQSALFALCAVDGTAVTGTACVMNVGMNGLVNGEDIASATVRMHLAPAWVEKHGGAGAIRIVHIADDGTVEILDTDMVGIDDKGNLIFEGISPKGLSTFALVSLGEATLKSSTTAMPTTAAAAPSTTAPVQTPLGWAAAIAAALIGGGVCLSRRKEA